MGTSTQEQQNQRILDYAMDNFSSQTHEYGREDMAGHRANRHGERVDGTRFNADKSVKDQAVKLSLMLVSGALVWTSGGVQEVKAQVCGDGGQYAPDNINGVVTPVCIGGSAGNRIYGTHPYDGYGPPPPVNNTAPPPVIQKPSSYGAVALDNKMGYVGTASKQASINLAIQKCGTDNCEIVMEYANQCMAYAYGQPLKGFKSKSFIENGLTKKIAEKNALSACRKGARDCKIFVSECSLP